jgi:outer membrane receptor protein involved in Fe transport
VPTWSGSFNATVKGDLGGRAWFLRGDVLWEGSSYFDNLEYNKNKGAARVNLRAGVDVSEGTRVETFVTNVTNNKRLPSGSTTNGFGGRATFGPPYEKRRVGVRVRADF